MGPNSGTEARAFAFLLHVAWEKANPLTQLVRRECANMVNKVPTILLFAGSLALSCFFVDQKLNAGDMKVPMGIPKHCLARS